jgi:two-component system response regulator YesN
MNLLIVDDEYYSRDNIKELLPWNEYGITQIKEANDGVNALALCESYAPDIVMADVRMPRMDGIEMSFKLREKFPHCAIIFMSGYCDKEYLKSAIKLRAISYIEKPISEGEIKEAAKAAIDCYKNNINHRNQKTPPLPQDIEILNFKRSQLALKLISPNSDIIKLQPQINEACIELPAEGCFVTILINLYLSKDHSQDPYTYSNGDFSQIIDSACLDANVNVLWVQKEHSIIIHIYGSVFDRNMIIQEKINSFCSILRENMIKLKINFVIGVGKPEILLQRLSASYKTAVQAVSRCFFKAYFSITCYEKSFLPQYSFTDGNILEYRNKLSETSKEPSMNFIRHITAEIKRYDTTEESEVKNYYFKLANELLQKSINKSIHLFDSFPDEHHLWQYVQSFNFIDELSEFLMLKTESYFELLEKKIDNNGPVDMVIEFIHINYNNDALSLTMISDALNLAPAYLSSIFKRKTGISLNQYITDYRIRKAKKLLEQKCIKVTEITNLIGYRDGNYFSKLFKKCTGMSPSEYRGTH